MSKTLLNSDIKNRENKQITIFKNLSEQRQEEGEEEGEEKEFIILKIYKSEIDKAVEDLKQLNKLNQYYEPDYKMIVERYKDTILDDCGWYEILKHAIRTTDESYVLERDEL